MLTIISAAIAAITEGLKLANTNASKEHITKVSDMRLRLQALEEKPYDQQDDAEIVSLNKELLIWIERAQAIMSTQGGA